MPRGGSNYIPRPDGDFDAWQRNYCAAAETWCNDHGVSTPLLDTVLDVQKDWDTAYPAHVAAQAAAMSARAEKENVRAAFERAIRPLTNLIQTDPAVTDADRATIGITVRDTSKTPAPTPTSAPRAQVSSGQRLSHTLRFTDAAAPTKRGKPPGTIGAEVWLALTNANTPTPPPGDSYRFLAVSSRGNLQATFPSADAGKVAHYALRWVSTRGEKGPWSEVCAATVAA